VWRPTLKAIGIRHRDARQTRHTFATLCLMAGMNPAYVSRQMGHTNAKMFFEVYSKWIDGVANAREKSKMDVMLGARNVEAAAAKAG
jgi:integrase